MILKTRKLVILYDLGIFFFEKKMVINTAVQKAPHLTVKADARPKEDSFDIYFVYILM